MYFIARQDELATVFLQKEMRPCVPHCPGPGECLQSDKFLWDWLLQAAGGGCDERDGGACPRVQPLTATEAPTLAPYQRNDDVYNLLSSIMRLIGTPGHYHNH